MTLFVSALGTDDVPDLSPNVDPSASASVFQDLQDVAVATTASIPSQLNFLPRPSNDRSMERQTTQSFNRSTALASGDPATCSATDAPGDGEGAIAVAGPSRVQGQDDGGDGGEGGKQAETSPTAAKPKGKKAKALSRTSSKAKVVEVVAPSVPDAPIATPMQYSDLRLKQPEDGENQAAKHIKTTFNVARLARLLWQFFEDYNLHIQTSDQTIKVLSQSVQDISRASASSSVLPASITTADDASGCTPSLPMAEQFDALTAQQSNQESRLVSLEDWTGQVGDGYNATHDWLRDIARTVEGLEEKVGMLEDERTELRRKLADLETHRMPPPAPVLGSQHAPASTPPRISSDPSSASGGNVARVITPLPPPQRSYSHTQRQWVPAVSSAVSASSTPISLPPAVSNTSNVSRAVSAGSVRHAPETTFSAKRHKSNTGRSQPPHLPNPAFDLRFTFPAAQPDPLRSIRALVEGILPSVDSSCVYGFEFTNAPLTYLALFQNSSFGSGSDIGHRFMTEWVRLPASSKYKAMTVEWGTAKEDSNAVDAMVKGLPLS